MIGSTISHYKILEKLGEGGMGVVYKAEDTKLRRMVALKFLPPHITSDREAKERFIHEAQAAAALSHNRICTVYEIDEHEGRSFIAMEYIEGESLKELIERGPLPLEKAIGIAGQIAAGLGRAHEKGIVHRDIKSANIMISAGDQVKIMDFGLAKAPGWTQITREGTTVGTAAYLSPEQARGKEADRRSDIWALGVLLYEMVAGRQPFTGDYDQAVMYSILNSRQEPLTALRTGVPKELERIADKCLEKDPAERYQTAEGLISDLQHLTRIMSEDVSGRSLPASKPSRGRRIGWAALVLAAAVIVITAVKMFPRFTGAPVQPAAEDSLDGKKMIVVLPFENLSGPEDEYFADGITDEITSRIAAVHELGVISRTSAMHYKGSNKPVMQIAGELGVDYVLEGTIRWNKAEGGESRVRVTPQLIRVSDDTHLWAENYDRVLEDIFEVQSEIATVIIEQLGVSILDRERRAVEAVPTENMIAYEAYLRGMNYLNRAGAREELFRKAETLFQQAIDLDPEFALAAAKLAEVNGELYFWKFDRTTERIERCRFYAEKALELQPDLPEAHMAMAGYYYMGFFDYDNALKEHSIASKDMPNNPKLFEAIAYIWRRQGLYEDAIGYLEKSAALDPKQHWYPAQIGLTYSFTRQYEKAHIYFDRSIALEPDQIFTYMSAAINILLWKGDTGECIELLESIPSKSNPRIMGLFFTVAYLNRDFKEAIGVISRLSDEELTEMLIRITPAALERAMAYRQMGDREQALYSFESARAIMEDLIEKDPEDGTAYGSMGIIYAGLGMREEAIREGRKGLELCRMNATHVTDREWDMARIYLMLEEYEDAMDHIEHLLSIPARMSVPFLDLHPEIDPLRDDPRFKRIIIRYSMDES